MPLKFVALLLLFLTLGVGSSFASEKIRAGLYLAQNEPPPPGTPVAPPKLHFQLQQVFGFLHYRLLKEQDFSLHNEWEQWFVPRRDFFIRLEPLPRQPGEPRFVDYQIYKDGFIIAKGVYQPRDGTPLFINGPDFHQGRFIFVLDAR